MHMFSDEVCPYECSAALLQSHHSGGSILVDGQRAGEPERTVPQVEPAPHPPPSKWTFIAPFSVLIITTSTTYF